MTMEKREFLDGLRAALNGRISPSRLEDTIDYYTEYINVETRKGRPVSEVLESLGDPRLIARTIIQTSGKEEAGSVWEDSASDEQGGFQGAGGKVFRVPGWLFMLIFFFLLLVVMVVFFSVLSFLAPVLLALALILLVVNLFRGWRH